MGAGSSGIEGKLMAFIVAELIEEEIYEGGDPLATDAVDSLGLEQLISYIEEEFGVRIGGAETVEENFGSIPALAAFVESRQTRAKA